MPIAMAANPLPSLPRGLPTQVVVVIIFKGFRGFDYSGLIVLLRLLLGGSGRGAAQPREHMRERERAWTYIFVFGQKPPENAVFRL